MPIVYKPVSRKVLIEQAKDNEKAVQKEIEKKAQNQAEEEEKNFKMNEDALSAVKKYTSRRDQAVAFKETVRVKLVEYALFSVFNKVMTKVSENAPIDKPSDASMKSIVSQFVMENGGPSEITSRMNNYGHSNYFLTEMNKIINKHFKVMIEDVNENQPETMEKVDDEQMDDFEQEVDQHVDDCEITDPLAQRVVAAIDQFVTQNAEDKEKIAAALQATKDKIEELQNEDMPEEDQEEIVEEYARLGKRLVRDIRNQDKTFFSEMVHTLSETVISNPELRKNFVDEASHVRMDKVINSVTTMYAFMEMTSVMKLVDVNANFIEKTLEDIKNA